MKTKTKIEVLSMLCLLCLMLSTVPNAHAGFCQDNSNPPNSILVRSREKIHQDKWPVANNLEFRAHIYEPLEWGYHVLGYRVTIDCFPTVVCTRTTKPSPYGGNSEGIDVVASGANVPNCTWCTVDIEFWLNKHNNIRKQDINWTFNIDPRKALPDHGWSVSGDVVIIYNEDLTADFTVSAFGIMRRLTSKLISNHSLHPHIRQLLPESRRRRGVQPPSWNSSS